jgi:hypothetical protein
MTAKVIKAIIVFPGAGISADDAERIQGAKDDNFTPAKSRRTRKCRPITLMMASQGTSWPNNHTMERPRGISLKA